MVKTLQLLHDLKTAAIHTTNENLTKALTYAINQKKVL